MTNVAKAMLDAGFSKEHVIKTCDRFANTLVDCSILSVEQTNRWIRECNAALAERSETDESQHKSGP